MKIPDYAKERISTLMQRTESTEEELTEEYEKIFLDKFIQNDPQFKTDEDRLRYASMVLWSRCVSRPPVKEYEVIPIGFSPVRTTRAGDTMSTLFALVRIDNIIVLKRIVFKGELSTKYREITPLAKYNVKLGRFQSGDLIADSRARFENPIRLKLTPQQILEKLEVKHITIEQSSKFPSAVGDDGYVDVTDWKAIRGIIIRASRGKREDESEWGLYVIADETVKDEPKITSDGRYMNPGFTCWVATEMMNYSAESEAYFVGSVHLNKNGEPFMNAYLIVPIYVRQESD
ncbi:hypothetical protein KJ925_05175 [Patescibacteria group bacterium]|nr:hypothetical protein [Patescibacteria group bacterium]